MAGPYGSGCVCVNYIIALPWAEIGAFMAELRGRQEHSARALELLILTATHTTELRAMRWGEVDLRAALWTIPSERTKVEKEHRVPLALAAPDVLRAMLVDGEEPMPGQHVFPSSRRGKRGGTMSERVMLALLARMDPVQEGKPLRWRDARTGKPITPHGFRSTFRDWVADHTR